ncbi:conserved hypothetical protein [Methylocella silvestris BL2]|uniref:Glycosyltransferase RgtA/B/C/D-like domain-containing protein n=1 Tax=Methylocella silvestris (strain DSM 15510 / CIP 108128 / LMG 27833 / NCIMB 13906 / BL2) TaxID=395965 RepID=B8ELJ3_METSB|nr:conserved hypothetical protein [Methylocella silvestris BL2]
MISIISIRNGFFFDDEIFNIRTVSSYNYSSLWDYVNREDVHPPVHYIINKAAFDVLGSWEAVKVLSAILNALGLAILGFFAFDKIDPRARLPLGIFLALCGTTIMWGASLRWYAYFDPLFAIVFALILFSDFSLTKRTMILAGGIVLLFYVNYETLCAAPVLVVTHLLRERKNFRRGDIITLFIAGLVGLALCIPQLLIFLEFARGHGANQTSSFLSALSQIAITLVVGNAVFPISVAAGVYTALIAALGVYFLFVKPKSDIDWIVLIGLAIGTLLMVVTGIAMKPRNSVFLLPLVFLIVASAVAALPPLWARAAIALIAGFQLLGVVNVAWHRDTLKGSFNIDYRGSLATLAAWKEQCKGKLIVFNHDSPLNYLLEENSIGSSSVFSPKRGTDIAAHPGDCVVLTKTYAGTLNADEVATLYRMLDNPALKQVAFKQLGEDRYAAIKSWVGKEPFPQYSIEFVEYDVTSDVTLPAWSGAIKRLDEGQE